jgi:hypothetical protein
MNVEISETIIEYFHNQLISGENVYAILDSAKQPEVAFKPYEFFSQWVSLYKGEPEEVLTDVAPYLINLSKDGEMNVPLIEWIATKCWGDSCAIFLESSVNLETLLKHFQQFLLVSDENGKTFYFRFYDPRVLRVYLPTCNAEELDMFFGPVQKFFMENESPENLVCFWRDTAELNVNNINL